MTKVGEWKGGKLTRASRAKLATLVESGHFADWWSEIMDQVASGKTLTAICVEQEILIGVLSKWIREDPDRKNDYMDAQKIYSELLVSQTIAISDETVTKLPDGTFAACNPGHNKNRINARQWAASKYDRERFGERVDFNVTQTVDVRIAIEEARGRALTRDVVDVDTKVIS